MWSKYPYSRYSRVHSIAWPPSSWRRRSRGRRWSPASAIIHLKLKNCFLQFVVKRFQTRAFPSTNVLSSTSYFVILKRDYWVGGHWARGWEKFRGCSKVWADCWAKILRPFSCCWRCFENQTVFPIQNVNIIQGLW